MATTKQEDVIKSSWGDGLTYDARGALQNVANSSLYPIGAYGTQPSPHVLMTEQQAKNAINPPVQLNEYGAIPYDNRTPGAMGADLLKSGWNAATNAAQAAAYGVSANNIGRRQGVLDVMNSPRFVDMPRERQDFYVNRLAQIDAAEAANNARIAAYNAPAVVPTPSAANNVQLGTKGEAGNKDTPLPTKKEPLPFDFMTQSGGTVTGNAGTSDSTSFFPQSGYQTNLTANVLKPTDYKGYMAEYGAVVGDRTPAMESRVNEQEARLAKAEGSNFNDQLMSFGLGMLGKRDFYGAMGDSGTKALEKYTENKVKHREARDVIDSRRDSIAAQQQAQKMQALGLAQAHAGRTDQMNAANESNRVDVEKAKITNDTNRAQIEGQLGAAASAYSAAALKATQGADKQYYNSIAEVAKTVSGQQDAKDNDSAQIQMNNAVRWHLGYPTLTRYMRETRQIGAEEFPPQSFDPSEPNIPKQKQGFTFGQ